MTSWSLSDTITQIISNSFARVEGQNTIKATFYINEEFDEKFNSLLFKDSFRNERCILMFISTVGKKDGIIFWKKANQEDFYSLEISNDQNGIVCDLCLDFLFDELKNNRNGILRSTIGKKKLNVREIGTEDGKNLLIRSVIDNRDEAVEKLCNFNFNVDYEFEISDQYGQLKWFNAIDKAWDNFVNSNNSKIEDSSNKIILHLLNANSKFPQGFNKADASDEVKNFVNMSEEIHRLVKAQDLQSVKQKVESVHHLYHIYKKNNESLLIFALKFQIMDIVKFLESAGFSIGSHEVGKLEKIYRKKFNKVDIWLTQFRHQDNAIKYPKSHLLILNSKSSIGQNDRQHHEHWKHVTESFIILDEIQEYSIVLQICALLPKLKIFFDFKHDTTYYFDPVSSIHTRGITYPIGIIEVGAIDLLEEGTKFKVIGVLIHELCHLAINMVYMNNFNPYQLGESSDKVSFINLVFEECKGNENFDEIITNVFSAEYIPAEYNPELIVRPYQMMMHYYKNPHRVDCCKEQYKELFNYVTNVVEPEFKNSLPILKELHEDKEVEFWELTNPMKAKILRQKIKFQGVKTSLFEILKMIGNDEDILSSLSTVEIRNILLDQKDIEYGDICKITSKYEFIGRRFFTHNSRGLDFAKIKEIVRDSNIFILSSSAGEGKSTVFERCCRRLKRDDSFKNFWVSCIKLKENQKLLSEFSKYNQNVRIRKVFELICNIVLPRTQHQTINYYSDFEVKILNKLFLEGKVILFFDGIDEICPDLNEFIMKVLKKIKESTSNQLWISTRPQQADQIQKVLNADVYKLEPYTDCDRKTIVKIIAEKLNVQDQILSMLKIFKRQFKSFYNPLLIEIIIELYEENKSLINTNIGQMFKNIFIAQMKKMDSKIDPKDRNVFDKFKLLFQVLALKFLFNEDQVKDLSIMQEWIDEKENWTVEKINRYGFATVDSNFLETDDKNLIGFIHYSYAEYFSAEFIYEKIFDKNNNNQEIEKIFSLLKSTIESDPTILMSFLKNYKNHRKISQSKTVTNKMKELIKDEIEKILVQPVKGNVNKLKNWSLFLHNENEILEELRNKEINMTNFEIINKVKTFKGDKAIIIMLNFMFTRWGENYEEELKNYLKILGVKSEKRAKNKNKSNLIPNDKWFKESKEKMFVEKLTNDVKKYLEGILKKYKENTSLNILGEEFGFPSSQFLLIFENENFISLLANDPREFEFLTEVSKQFVAENDQNHESFSKIVKNVRVMDDQKNSVISDNFIKKLLEPEIFEKILQFVSVFKPQAIQEHNNDKLGELIFTILGQIIESFVIFISSTNFDDIHETTVERPFTTKRNLRLKKQKHVKKIKKNKNHPRNYKGKL